MMNRPLSIRLSHATPKLQLQKHFIACLLLVCPLLMLSAQRASSEDAVRFSVRQLAVDANEGIAAADVDGDGKPDLVAGRAWYRNPDWTPRPLRNIDDWNGYVQSNGDFIFDVNGDGRPDVVAGSFLPREVYWYENPGADGLRLGQQWKQRLWASTPQSQNEGVIFADLDQDGRPEWIANSWAKDVPMYVGRILPRQKGDGSAENQQKNGAPKFRLASSQIGARGNGHGCGVGDLDGDGRADILVGQGWYQQPAEDAWSKPWKFHSDWDLHASLPMLVKDLDGDGRNDIVYGNGHDFGLYWWRNLGADDSGKLQFKSHTIDREYSQPHTLAWGDLTGDGRPELITGKRYYAHNGNDPGGKSPPAMYYYVWDANGKRFQRFPIEQGHVGTGLQIVVEDFNGDGRNDIAVAGKSGTHLILNQGSSSADDAR